MKISLCITTFNEEANIEKLLKSIMIQTLKPEEVIIVDNNSTDNTTNIITKYAKYIQLRLIKRRCSRSKGRNIAIKLSKNKIIALTDAGCILDKCWLENITKPFLNKKVKIVSGFYKMSGNKPIQKAFSVFLGVDEKYFNSNKYLITTRSVAFRKLLWKSIGGFSEVLEDTAEDTMFNYQLEKHGILFHKEKDAVVNWEMPHSLFYGIKKMYLYAKGDAKTGIYKFNNSNITAHNIKVLNILLRYLTGIILSLILFILYGKMYFIFIFIFIYSVWIYFKVYIKTKNAIASLYGIIIQYLSDITVLIGFIIGVIKK